MINTVIGIFIEPRKCTEIFYNINNFFTVLPNIKLYFFCGKNLKQYYDYKLAFYENLIIIELPVANLTSIEYSDLLKTHAFWAQFDATHCLTIQTDGCLCVNSPYSIDYFLKYDFIGGYAKNQWANKMRSLIQYDTAYPCLNGGFSIRNISKCIEVIKTFPPCPTKLRNNDTVEVYPEDIYFAYGMLTLGYNVGLDIKAVNFCTHTRHITPSFCVHNFKKYASPDQYANFLNYCPQYNQFVKIIPDESELDVHLNPHFIILICTYYRENGSTIDFLKRSIDSVLAQQYKNWTLLIVGDNYTDLDDLSQLIETKKQETTNNIVFFNNLIVERDTILPTISKTRLWYCAGANSSNMGLTFARKHEFKYYARIDDDDYWKSNHLKVMAHVYKRHPNCVFVNTKSTHPDFNIIPNIDAPVSHVKWNPRTKVPRIAHSSLSFRCDVILHEYKTHLKKGISKPSDQLMIKSIFDFIIDNPQYYGICVNQLTCFHDEERQST
jgi:hypothetical protein